MIYATYESGVLRYAVADKNQEIVESRRIKLDPLKDQIYQCFEILREAMQSHRSALAPELNGDPGLRDILRFFMGEWIQPWLFRDMEEKWRASNKLGWYTNDYTIKSVNDMFAAPDFEQDRIERTARYIGKISKEVVE